MGLKNIQKSDLQGAPQNSKEHLELYPGEQAELWEELINVRIQYDENYQFIKLRGGTSLKHSFGSKIITLYPFTAPINGGKKDYLAVHTTNGDVYLCERETHLEPASPSTPPKIFTAVFDSDQIEFLTNGKILYAFDVINSIYKVYDIELDQSFDWLDNLSDSITSYSWNELGDWQEDNIWGYEDASDIIVMHSFSAGKYTDPVTTNETFEAFTTQITDAKETYLAYEDPGGTARRTTDNDGIAVFPNSPDLQPLIGRNGNLRINEAGTEETNEDFVAPFLYRGYLIVDLLIDGSYAPPGRPITVAASMFRATRRRKQSLRFTIAAAGPNVVKRFLFSTRWQINENNVFNPSRSDYPNSAFFFAREIEVDATSFTDKTPDDKLFNPLSGYIPIRSGINQTFFLKQLEPHSATSIESSMIIGGYNINRPIPVPYTNNENPAKGNAYIKIGAGETFENDSEVSLMFEYTDGKKSAVVDTGQVLTDSEELIDDGDTGEAATATAFITQEPGSSGAFEVKDANNPSDLSEFFYSEQSASNMADKIVDAINSGLDLDVSASKTFNTSTMQYGIKVDYNQVGLAGNSVSLTFTYSSGFAIEGNTGGTYTMNLSGGEEPFGFQLRSGNQLILHSLNALVTKVYVIIKDSIETGGTPGSDPVAAETNSIRALNPVAENSTPGDVTVTYDGHTTNISLNPFQTLEDIARSFVNFVNNDASALITGVFVAPNRFYYVEKRTGSVHNGKEATIFIDDAIKPGAGNVEGSKAETGVFTVINQLGSTPTTPTSFQVRYDGVFVDIAGTAAMTVAQLAQQIADDVNADTDIDVTATATNAEVVFTEKRIGSYFNGNEVEIFVNDVIKQGDTLPVAATAEWEMTDGPTDFGAIELRNEFDPNDLCLIHVDETDAITDIITRLREAFNGVTTDPKVIDANITSPITASSAGAGDIIRLTADDDGTDGNDFVFRLTYSSGAQSGAPLSDFMAFDGSTSGEIIKQFTGGVDGTKLDVVNPQIDTVEGGTDIGDAILDATTATMAGGADGGSGTPGTITEEYKLFDTVEFFEPEFHGRVIYLPNSQALIDQADPFTPPEAGDIREVVDLFDYIVPAIPYEMPLIFEQARIKSRAPIQRLVVDTFDVDKSLMRMKVQIFTDRNIQVGYLVTGQEASDYDFEVIAEGVPITSKFSAWRVENNTIYQADDGIYNLSANGYRKMVDRYRYGFLSKNLTKVIYNQFHKEYWLYFDDSQVLVTTADGEVRKRFTYPAAYGPATHGAKVLNQIYGAHDDGLYAEELAGQTDGATDISGQMVTTHIGRADAQVKILEVAVSGQGLSGNVNLDLQRSRLERNNSAWQTSFNADVATTPETLYIHGVPFTFTNRAVMPKIQLELSGDSTGFVSHILFTHIILENKGKAR